MYFISYLHLSARHIAFPVINNIFSYIHLSPPSHRVVHLIRIMYHSFVDRHNFTSVYPSIFHISRSLVIGMMQLRPILQQCPLKRKCCQFMDFNNLGVSPQFNISLYSGVIATICLEQLLASSYNFNLDDYSGFSHIPGCRTVAVCSEKTLKNSLINHC